jgi:hypothetical protein
MRVVPTSHLLAFFFGLASMTSIASFAHAGQFENLLKKSVEVYDQRAVLLPFVRTCDREKAGFRKLFCEALNERLKSQHQSKLYQQTFEIGEHGPLLAKYVARPKPTMELTVRGCLTCSKPMLTRAGGDISKARFFVFRQPAAIRVRRGERYELTKIDITKLKDKLPEEMTKRMWQRDIKPHLRLELLYRPVAGVTRIGRYKYGVVNFELVGHRVYDKCSGKVYSAQPKMDSKYPVDKNDMTCPQNRQGKVAKVLPPKLPENEVKKLMADISSDLMACYNQFGGKGEFPVNIAVSSSGRVKSVKVLGKKAGTPTANCVARLVKNARFPKFSGRRVLHLPWPFAIEPR